MAEGLKWFLMLIVPVLWVIWCSIAYINYRYNHIWRNAQFSWLTVGQVRWQILSPLEGEGHVIYVVKEIRGKKAKNRIVYDRYILKNGKYVLTNENMECRIDTFYHHTNPEPVYSNERLGK